MNPKVKLLRTIFTLIILINAVLIAYLTINTGYLQFVLANRANLDINKIIFLLINLVRVLLLLGASFAVLQRHPDTSKIVLFSIVAELLGVWLNLFFMKVPLTNMWLATTAAPILIDLILLYLIRNYILSGDGYMEDKLRRQKKRGRNFDTIGTNPEIIAINPYHIDRLEKKYADKKAPLSTIILFILLCLLGGLGYLYKDSFKGELKYFLEKTNIVSDSTAKKLINKFVLDQPVPLSSIMQVNNLQQGENNPKQIKVETNIKNSFSDAVFTKRSDQKKVSHYELGHAYMSKNNIPSAVIEFNNALNDNMPIYTKMLTHYFLATLYEKKLNDKKSALKQWQILKSMTPTGQKYQLNLPAMAINEVARLTPMVTGAGK